MSHALNKIIEQSLGDFPNSGQISASSQNRIKTTQSSSSSSLLPSTPMKIEDMIVRNLSKNTKENAHNKQPEIIIDIASSPEAPRQQQPKQSSQSQKNLNQVQVIKQPQSQPSHSQAQQQAMQKQRKIKQLAQTVLQQQTVQQKPNHNIYNRPTLADQIKKKSSSQSSSMLQSTQQQREQLIQQQLQREKSQQQQRELQMQREKAQQRELQREKQSSSSSKASNHTSISITAIPNANAVSNESVSSSNRQTNQSSSSQRYSSSAVTSTITPTSSALDLSPQSIQAIQLGMLQGTNFNALQNQSANPISAHSLSIPSHNYLSHLFSSTSNRNLIPSRSSLPSISQLDNSPLGFNPIYLHQFATTHPTGNSI